jgi:hypothetical protein
VLIAASDRHLGNDAPTAALDIVFPFASVLGYSCHQVVSGLSRR